MKIEFEAMSEPEISEMLRTDYGLFFNAQVKRLIYSWAWECASKEQAILEGYSRPTEEYLADVLIRIGWPDDKGTHEK